MRTRCRSHQLRGSAVKCVLLALALLSLATSAWGAPAYVQSASNTDFGGLSTSVLAFTAQNVTAGSLIAMCIAWHSTTVTLNSVTDDRFDTYSIVGPVLTGNGYSAQCAYAKNVAGGTMTTVTANFSAAAGDRIWMAIHEVSGLDTTAPFDVSHSQFQGTPQQPPGTEPNMVSSGSATTTVNGDYIFGFTFDTGLGFGKGHAGAGFTRRENDDAANLTNDTEDQIQPTAGPIAATFTTESPFTADLTWMMAFKPAAATPLWSGVLAPNRATDWTVAGVDCTGLTCTGGIPSAAWTRCTTPCRAC